MASGESSIKTEALLAGRFYDSTISPNHWQSTLTEHSPELFSHAMMQCVLGLSLHSFETAGKYVFVNLDIGT